MDRTEKGSAAAKRALSPRSLAALTIFIDFVILAIFFVPTIRARTNQVNTPKQAFIERKKQVKHNAINNSHQSNQTYVLFPSYIAFP